MTGPSSLKVLLLYIHGTVPNDTERSSKYVGGLSNDLKEWLGKVDARRTSSLSGQHLVLQSRQFEPHSLVQGKSDVVSLETATRKGEQDIRQIDKQ